MAASRWIWCVLVIGLCYVVAGCGRSGVGEPVTAVLLKDGQPIRVEGDGDEDSDDEFGYEVKLFLLDESGGFADAQECSGDLQEGEEITIYGPNLGDVPAGKYRVAVHHWGPGERAALEDEDAEVEKVDLLEGKYSKENSQMTVEVSPGSHITIDLDAGTATD